MEHFADKKHVQDIVLRKCILTTFCTENYMSRAL